MKSVTAKPANTLTWNLAVSNDAEGAKHVDIQMYGVIDGGWLDDAVVSTATVVSDLQKHADAKSIDVHINSIGGNAFGGVAMYNALSSHAGRVTCYVEGLAASAASLVAMAGKTVMGKGAMMMIHSPWTVAMGNADDLRKTAAMLDKVQSSLADIYVAKTGKTVDAVKKLLDGETWMTADEAVAAGFADAVAEDVHAETKIAAAGVRWGGVMFPRASLPRHVFAMAKAHAAHSHKGKAKMTMKSETCDGCERDMDDGDSLYCSACHSTADAKALLALTGGKTLAEAVATASGWKIAAGEVSVIRAQLAEQQATVDAQVFDAAISEAKSKQLLATSDAHKRNVAALAFKGKPDAVANLKSFLAALDPLIGSADVATPSAVREPPPSAGATGLTAEERRIAHRMGVSVEAATKNKARLLTAVPNDTDVDADDEDAA